MKLILSLALTVVVASTSMVIAGGHDGNPAVTARKAHMQLYQHNLSILGNMARGNTDYDAAAAQAAADNMVALTTMSQAGYWLPGTTNAELGDETRTLPAIFGADSTARTIGADLAAASAALAAVASDGLDAVGPALGPVGGACTACHRPYRARN
ncbi:MAG: cytochrome c [Boseongicola sp.]|nr:cytochrome c [Boseongicola sp.]